MMQIGMGSDKKVWMKRSATRGSSANPSTSGGLPIKCTQCELVMCRSCVERQRVQLQQQQLQEPPRYVQKTWLPSDVLKPGCAALSSTRLGANLYHACNPV